MQIPMFTVVEEIMFQSSVSTAPKRIRPGLVSHILLQSSDTPGNNLAITWVEVEPGHRQSPHSHAPEQVYVIIRGEGRMSVGDQTTAVATGSQVHIPPNVAHGIENTGDGKLVYVSASSPAFDLEAPYDTGELS